MRASRWLSLAFLAVCGLQTACSGTEADDKTKEGKEVTTASGLKYIDLKPGTGDEAKAGKTVVVHYTGWLKNGKKFDSSLDRGRPFDFKLGAGDVIKGWDEGVAGMKVGGKRKLIIPSKLGYGERGAGEDIPPNSELIFEVDLRTVVLSNPPPRWGVPPTRRVIRTATRRRSPHGPPARQVRGRLPGRPAP
jgi:hypothetical protein